MASEPPYVLPFSKLLEINLLSLLFLCFGFVSFEPWSRCVAFLGWLGTCYVDQA